MRFSSNGVADVGIRELACWAGQFTNARVLCVRCIIHPGASSQGEFCQANPSIRCHDILTLFHISNPNPAGRHRSSADAPDSDSNDLSTTHQHEVPHLDLPPRPCRGQPGPAGQESEHDGCGEHWICHAKRRVPSNLLTPRY